MDFNFYNSKVSALFPYDEKQLYIPRYQRDYSWGSKEVSEFLNDILSRISLVNGNLITSSYFFGTLILASEDELDSKIEVIDGQQRVTTITIFFSALAKCFYSINEEELGDLMWEKIISKNRNGKKFKTLNNDTANDYFEYLIQMKENCEKPPIDSEQDKIKSAYDFFIHSLSEVNIKNKLYELNDQINFLTLSYVDILKAIRDQLLFSKVICIKTKNRNSSNLIFEILNGKGKKLDSIDLIKNSIFNYLDEEEPTDDAYNTWSSIKNNLCSRKERIEFQTFLRHYWAYKYTKVVEDGLYDEFLNTIKEENYSEFIHDMEEKSKLYIQIVCPMQEDYDNRKEKLYIIECLKYINNYFKIKQTRIVLLALFDAKNRKVISNDKLKQILVYLHQFHFVYNGLCTKRANVLDTKYTNFAKQLNQCTDSNKGHNTIDNLIKQLDEIFPTYKEFESEFIKLEFSKSYNPSNMLCKYVLNNLEKHYSNEDLSKFNGSIEHILPEVPSNKSSLNIGNLILLEESLNQKVETFTFSEKIQEYKNSDYKYVSDFCSKYDKNQNFTSDMVKHRAKSMANDFYYNVLGRPKPSSNTLSSKEKRKNTEQLQFVV